MDMMNNWILGDLDDMIFGDCQQQISERQASHPQKMTTTPVCVAFCFLWAFFRPVYTIFYRKNDHRKGRGSGSAEPLPLPLRRRTRRKAGLPEAERGRRSAKSAAPH